MQIEYRVTLGHQLFVRCIIGECYFFYIPVIQRSIRTTDPSRCAFNDGSRPRCGVGQYEEY